MPYAFYGLLPYALFTPRLTRCSRAYYPFLSLIMHCAPATGSTPRRNSDDDPTRHSQPSLSRHSVPPGKGHSVPQGLLLALHSGQVQLQHQASSQLSTTSRVAASQRCVGPEDLMLALESMRDSHAPAAAHDSEGGSEGLLLCELENRSCAGKVPSFTTSKQSHATIGSSIAPRYCNGVAVAPTVPAGQQAYIRKSSDSPIWKTAASRSAPQDLFDDDGPATRARSSAVSVTDEPMIFRATTMRNRHNSGGPSVLLAAALGSAAGLSSSSNAAHGSENLSQASTAATDISSFIAVRQEAGAYGWGQQRRSSAVSSQASEGLHELGGTGSRLASGSMPAALAGRGSCPGPSAPVLPDNDTPGTLMPSGGQGKGRRSSCQSAVPSQLSSDRTESPPSQTPDSSTPTSCPSGDDGEGEGGGYLCDEDEDKRGSTMRVVPSLVPRPGVGRSPTFDSWRKTESPLIAAHPSAPAAMFRPVWCMADYRQVKLVQAEAGCSIYRVRGSVDLDLSACQADGLPTAPIRHLPLTKIHLCSA